MADAAMLKVEGLTFRYEDMAMVFDLALARGQCLALLGQRGAGKSTLLSLVAGFEAQLAGRVMISGRDVNGSTPGERPVTRRLQGPTPIAQPNESEERKEGGNGTTVAERVD